MTIFTRRASAPVIDSVKPDDWRDQAKCRDEDPELWFPIGTSGPAEIQIQIAQGVCGRCPVAGECLRWATDNDIADGIWGGRTEGERRWAKRHGVVLRAVV